jgi:hypothetical protein
MPGIRAEETLIGYEDLVHLSRGEIALIAAVVRECFHSALAFAEDGFGFSHEDLLIDVSAAPGIAEV